MCEYSGMKVKGLACERLQLELCSSVGRHSCETRAVKHGQRMQGAEHEAHLKARSGGRDDRAVDGGAPEAIGAEQVDGPQREQQRERRRVVLETREQQRSAAICVQVEAEVQVQVQERCTSSPHRVLMSAMLEEVHGRCTRTRNS